MFKNKSAWFSDSVEGDIPKFWVSQGGVVSDWKTAEYLFSDDASCPDTESASGHQSTPGKGGYILNRSAARQRANRHATICTYSHICGIHESNEYVTDRATVFHSAYLSTCRLRRSTKSVPLGHYLLPPVSVQREVKASVGRFIWEQDEMFSVTTPSGNQSTEQILNIRPDANKSQSEKRKKRQDNNNTNTSPSGEERVCCNTQFYPVNNMVSGYVHIDQLKKFSGELHDFLPHHSGYSVSRFDSRRRSCQDKGGD